MPFDHFVGRGRAASALSLSRPRAFLPLYLPVVVMPLDQTRARPPISKYARKKYRTRYDDEQIFKPLFLSFNSIWLALIFFILFHKCCLFFQYILYIDSTVNTSIATVKSTPTSVGSLSAILKDETVNIVASLAQCYRDA